MFHVLVIHARSSYRGLSPHLQRAHDGRTQSSRANEHGCHVLCSEQHKTRQPYSRLTLNVGQKQCDGIEPRRANVRSQVTLFVSKGLAAQGFDTNNLTPKCRSKSYNVRSLKFCSFWCICESVLRYDLCARARRRRISALQVGERFSGTRE